MGGGGVWFSLRHDFKNELWNLLAELFSAVLHDFTFYCIDVKINSQKYPYSASESYLIGCPLSH